MDVDGYSPRTIAASPMIDDTDASNKDLTRMNHRLR